MTECTKKEQTDEVRRDHFVRLQKNIGRATRNLAEKVHREVEEMEMKQYVKDLAYGQQEIIAELQAIKGLLGTELATRPKALGAAIRQAVEPVADKE